MTAEPMRFRPGEKVSHRTFGEGVVVRQQGQFVTVAFPGLKGSLGGGEATVFWDQLTRRR